MSPKTKSTDTRTRFRFLDPVLDQIADEVSLEAFSVLLPEFTPAEDQKPLDDGEPPTKLGARFRHQWAELHNVSEEEVDHGLIRDIEALSADHDANIRGLARPYRLRNHAGEQIVVRFTAHTPLVAAALINGRMLSRVGRHLPEETPVLTTASGTHPFMPAIEVVDADHAYRISEAQQRVEKLRDYHTDDQDFIDSLALEGVITAPVVAPFHIQDAAGNAGYLVQTDDGWRRLTASRGTLSELLGVNADLTYKHWENAGGTMTIRSHTADTVRRSLGWLRFVGSDKAKLLYPTSRNPRSVDAWMKDIAGRNPEVRAFHRLRTVDIELVLAIRPRPGKSYFDVFYIDMAGRHVLGLSAKDWDKASVEGVVAVRAIDTLRDKGFINDAERAVWLGETSVATKDAPNAEPFRNQLVAGTALMAALTTEGEKAGRRQITRNALAEHGLPNHPDRAATVAAAQAAVVFEVDGKAEVGQVTSTLASLFKHASLWKDQTHPGDYWWFYLIEEDPDDLYNAALDELGQTFELIDKNAGALGPYQRAMVALTGIAHITNRELIRRHDSMTRTGRGGRHGVVKSDPIAMLLRMVQKVDGLAQCLAIIKAAIKATPVVPTDPVTGAEMTETWLRKAYLDTDDAEAGEDTGEDPLDAATQWWTDVDDVLERAENLQGIVTEMMEDRRVPPELLGDEDGEYDEHTAPLMFQRYGVPNDIAEKIVDAVDPVTRFANRGAAFNLVRRGE
jgi:hypothetical protein